jgi:hypothetical protein
MLVRWGPPGRCRTGGWGRIDRTGIPLVCRDAGTAQRRRTSSAQIVDLLQELLPFLLVPRELLPAEDESGGRGRQDVESVQQDPRFERSPLLGGHLRLVGHGLSVQ